MREVTMIVVRHGEQERIGQNGPLTDRGVRQAAALALSCPLTAEDRLISSSRLRARQTAAAFGRAPEVFDDLSEFRFGPSWDWQQADDREDLALWRPEHTAGGESLAEFQTRVDRVLDDLVTSTSTAPAATSAPASTSDGRIVLCVHSGVIDAILRWAFGGTPQTPWTTEACLGHTSITELRHWPQGRHIRGAPRHTLVVRLGDVSHLPADLVSGRG